MTKALIVDDSALSRKMLLDALTHAGLDTIDLADIKQARDGREAVDLTEQEQFDIIFMDWNMPNMLGIDAVKEIRKVDKKVPIIMVTVLGDESHIKQAIHEGVNDYILKPFHPEEAAKCIQKHLIRSD